MNGSITNKSMQLFRLHNIENHIGTECLTKMKRHQITYKFCVKRSTYEMGILSKIRKALQA
jgi:hypothetical protein